MSAVGGGIKHLTRRQTSEVFAACTHPRQGHGGQTGRAFESLTAHADAVPAFDARCETIRAFYSARVLRARNRFALCKGTGGLHGGPSDFRRCRADVRRSGSIRAGRSRIARMISRTTFPAMFYGCDDAGGCGAETAGCTSEVSARRETSRVKRRKWMVTATAITASATIVSAFTTRRTG